MVDVLEEGVNAVNSSAFVSVGSIFADTVYMGVSI